MIDLWCFNATFNNISAISWPELRQETVVARYNNLVRHANKFLKYQIKSVPGLHYWNIYSVKYTTVNIFQDGVYFNQIGLQRYYINVRGAIIQSLGY